MSNPETGTQKSDTLLRSPNIQTASAPGEYPNGRSRVTPKSVRTLPPERLSGSFNRITSLSRNRRPWRAALRGQRARKRVADVEVVGESSLISDFGPRHEQGRRFLIQPLSPLAMVPPRSEDQAKDHAAILILIILFRSRSRSPRGPGNLNRNRPNQPGAIDPERAGGAVIFRMSTESFDLGSDISWDCVVERPYHCSSAEVSDFV